jgi:hypothetical protein
VQQANTNTWKPVGVQQVGNIVLYDAKCAKSAAQGTTSFDSATGLVTLQVNGAAAGAQYHLGIKYYPGSLVGQTVSKPYPAVPYTFQTYLDSAAIIPS